MSEIFNYTKGDTISFTFQLWKNKKDREYWNLENNQIRFQADKDLISIKKATSNVVGGSIEQIQILDSSKGLFIINISKEESRNLIIGLYDFEIQITDAEDQVFTVEKSKFSILEDKIKWLAI
ncbi:MAG: hypothetical protein V1901_03695 [Patescibacteria group bacterium]